MEELNLKARIKNVTRKISGKGSYTPEFEIPSFQVKSLCLDGIIVDSIEKSASMNAVDEALSSVGSLAGKNKPDVVLKISIKNGIEVFNRKNKHKQLYSYKLHQVGYCNVDSRYSQIFVFIAGRNKKDLKCHIFLCDDSAKARAICLTLAKSFQNSFENWKKNKEMSPNADKNHTTDNVAFQQTEKPKSAIRKTSAFLEVPNFDPDHRRSSLDSISSNDEGKVFEKFLRSEGKDPRLLRRKSTDWEVFENDEEIRRKMEGDFVLWEDQE